MRLNQFKIGRRRRRHQVPATVAEVVGQLRTRLVTDFNSELHLDGANCLNSSMCSTFTIPVVADMDSKLADVFPGQDTASFFVFIVPPPDFIPSRIQDQFRNIQEEIQDLKRQIVRMQREKESEKRQTAREFQNLRTEIASFRQAHHNLNLRVVLDSARRKVLDLLFQDPNMYWSELRSQFTDTRSLYEWLCNELTSVDYRPSDQALRLLCQPSELRNAGSEVAHHADKEELALAISKYDGPYREELILLFEFAFGERFYARF